MMNQLRAKEEWTALRSKFADFTPMQQQGDCWVTNGRLPIVDASGKCWEVYSVEITLLSTYTDSLPYMVETDGKIRRTADWHVNADGSCCVGTEARQYYLLKGNNTLLNWVETLAIPYLANHKLRVLTKAYVEGERSHGAKGVWEEYADIFPDRGGHSVFEYLKLLTGRVLLAKNALCFCGSGKKYKRCFLKFPTRHRRDIPMQVMAKDLKGLNNNFLLK